MTRLPARLAILVVVLGLAYLAAVNVSMRMLGGPEPEPVTYAGGGY